MARIFYNSRTVPSVKVQDSGIGIPPERMNSLFERFCHIQTEDGQGREGWGLGLYFCKLAVEAHGGRIDVQSSPGRGTLVRFAIPLNDASDKRPPVGLMDGVRAA